MHLDLHVHSTASDGCLTAEEIVAEATHSQLAALAITDHDSVEAVQPGIDAARKDGLLVIPGVELSAVHDERDVHILGYFVDHTDSDLLATLRLLREARLDRARLILDALAEAGFVLALDDVLLLADGGSVGRSHVARALVAAGHSESVTDAFERLIGRGRPFYIPKPVASPASVIQTVTSAHGIAVLAHPGPTGIDSLIPELVDAGLSGIEVYHPQHDELTRERYSRVAANYELVVTGGSDFHGLSSPGASIGEVEVPDDTLDRLLERADRRNA